VPVAGRESAERWGAPARSAASPRQLRRQIPVAAAVRRRAQRLRGTPSAPPPHGGSHADHLLVAALSLSTVASAVAEAMADRLAKVDERAGEPTCAKPFRTAASRPHARGEASRQGFSIGSTCNGAVDGDSASGCGVSQNKRKYFRAARDSAGRISS
jgi:hypothetical protein